MTNENPEEEEIFDIPEDDVGLLQPGLVVANRYEIRELIGQGGMGSVYKAHDRFLDEPVALKLLRASFASTTEAAMRFRSEIKLARKVTHRNVCRIHEYSEVDGYRFLSMEYVDGRNLKELIQSGQPLPVEDVADIATQIAKGLQAIHDRGIIHRDLKNANIMRGTDGEVRLMDFGIAKRWQERDDGEEREAGLTGVGDAVGTPEYMSPEQARGQKLEFQSDIYSLGICLFEILTGNLPFVGATSLDTLIMQIQEPTPLERVPDKFRPILAKAMAKEVEDRYASARGLIADLRALDPRHASASPDGDTTKLKPVVALPRRPLPSGGWVARGVASETSRTSRVQALTRALRDPEVNTRWRAAVGLCQIGPEAGEALGALGEAIHDAAPAVADAAAQAYRAIAGGPPPEQLVVKAAAAAGLSVDSLLAALRDKDTFARWRAAVALGEIGPGASEATSALVDSLDDEDANVRSAAAVALGKIGPAAQAAARALTAALTDDEDQVFRAHVARALGRMGPGAREAVPGLIGALCEEDVSVRDEIAEALVAIGPAAVPSLMEALQDDDPRVRYEAASALTRLGTALPHRA